ncbi:zinc finger protein 672 [Ixodes scapularis]|uniref:Zinc finger protein, putative n=1 Tax=Ixodes scapularis TaxID=6945 RepID=B7PGN3_IXOSC|nr:zinc finger protein 672 [Ixodes scapularis]EEC05755.1 zinc finger protein, putative [Ixodes scapularis]|eukprot:XP_002400950.1 zinc finger protein, putative [Ixodes scapularis]
MRNPSYRYVCLLNTASLLPPFPFRLLCADQEDAPSILATVETFSCLNCSSVFSSRDFLEKHREAVHGRPHVCGTCGQSFALRRALRTHKRTHTGERPYVCPQCSKGFVTKSDLNRHSHIHTGAKPHHCGLCGFRSICLSDVRKHEVVMHTKEYPHTCVLCGKGFIKPSYLRGHLAKQHANREEQE